MPTHTESPADLDALINAVAPHDDFSFDELSKHYNFRKVSDRTRLFVRLLIKELNSRVAPVRVLDIGCGNGISTGRDAQSYLEAIHLRTDELWGVEPDSSINQSNA